MTRIRLLLLAALLAWPQFSRGESHPSNWRAYQTPDGMSDNQCVSVAIGPRGKIWTAHLTNGGVTSLDGFNLTNFPSPGAFSGRVYESPGGQLWVACPEGLQQFRDDKWTLFAVPEIAAAFRAAGSNAVLRVPICPIRLGRALFLLPDGLRQLDILNPNASQTTVLSAAAKTHLGGFSGMLTSARDASLWIAGEHGLMHAGPARSLSEESVWTEYLSPPQIQNLREPVEDKDGGITVVADSLETRRPVVAHFDGQQWEIHPIAGGENIRMAWRASDKSFWAAGTNALFQLEPGKTELTPNEEEIAHEYFDVAIEPGGQFWLATSDGLFRYSPPTWRTPPGALNDPVTALARDPEGRLWAASRAALHLLSEIGQTNYPLPPDVVEESQGPRVVCALTNETLVLETGDHLLQFNIQSRQFVSIANPQKIRQRVAGLFNDGSLCVQSFGPQGAGLSRLELYDGANFRPFPYALPTNNLGNELQLLASPNGNLWLAGAKGIARYRDQKWQGFGPRDETAPPGLGCFAEISEDRIWWGFQDKIWECDGKSWRLLQGAMEKVNSFLAARDSGIWVAANTGIYRYYRDQWVVNRDTEGLPGGGVFALCEDTAGKLWLGASRGAAVYHPEADPDAPQVSVTAQPDENGDFREGSPVTIGFGGQDKWKFTPASRLLYAYQLDGREWSPYQEGRSARFSQLTPDKHYFQVKSMDRNWNESLPQLYEFAIVLPWYKESRLLLISCTGLIIIIFFAGVAVNRHLRLRRSHAEVEAQVALRTKQLEIASQELLHSQKMNALGTLAAGIAHDFNSILSIIKGSAQIIEDNLDDPEKIRTRANRINTVVEQGAGIVKAMLGFSRPSSGEQVLCDVNEVIAETIRLLGDRFLREVEVRFEPEPSLPKVPASKDFIQQILLNLIFNAAEAMTDHRQILLSARLSKNLPAPHVLAPARCPAYVLISVKDFGSGVAPDIISRIFEPFFTTKSLSARRGTGLGLSMVYELARQMEAGLALESVVGEGSTFTLILPVKDLPVDESRPPN